MRWLAAAGLALALAGCGGPQPKTFDPKPDQSSRTSPASPGPAMAKLKRAAGIAPCPKPGLSPKHSVQGGAPTVGPQALPELTLACFGGGRPVTLSRLTGQPTVINVWASWCGPCRKEMPFLGQAARAYAGEVRVLGINALDFDPQSALKLAASTGATYPHLVDPQARSRAELGYASGLPLTIFVDVTGRMVGTEREPFGSYADVAADIDKYFRIPARDVNR